MSLSADVHHVRPAWLRLRVLAGSLALVAGMGTFFAAGAYANGPYTPNTAGPATTDGVVPTYHPGNITTCPAGTSTFINTSDTGPGNQNASYSQNGVFFYATVTDGTWLSFYTNLTDYTVYVKGGPAYDKYDYTNTGITGNYEKTSPPTTDSRLHMPVNNGGNISTISHYLVCGSVPQQTVSYTLSVGYADSFRGVAPFFPSPWQGDPNVIFVGCNFNTTDQCQQSNGVDLYDSGALLLDNTGTANLDVTAASVTITNCGTFDPWPGLNETVPPGKELILTQTGGPAVCGAAVGPYNFDTSESNTAPANTTAACTNDGAQPSISITINGTPQSFTDTAQVLNTGGIDPPACSGGNSSEYHQWQSSPL